MERVNIGQKLINTCQYILILIYMSITLLQIINIFDLETFEKEYKFMDISLIKYDLVCPYEEGWVIG